MNPSERTLHSGMASAAQNAVHIAIACGGTGGHLYPGLAVAERLWDAGARVTLVVSPKEVDQQALRGDGRFEILTIPAIGFSPRRALRFVAGFLQSRRKAVRAFQEAPPQVLLSMGGFTSVPPALAVRRLGGRVFLHEANAIPGRANRWLARFANQAFVHFPEAAGRLRIRDVEVVGMPVRIQFQEIAPESCRVALGLKPGQPVLLVMGGSQGATGVNNAIVAAAPEITAKVPGLQWLHLTGVLDEVRVRAAYRAAGLQAVVRPFLTEMELALGAADAAIARAGASSAAELAAVGVPCLLLPYPHAADDHQSANARALERAGAALWMPEWNVRTQAFVTRTVALLTDGNLRARLKRGLAAWHRSDADQVLADRLLGRKSQPPGSGTAGDGGKRELAPLSHA